MTPTFDNTCAVILAGGRGRRMQDQDKGLLLWQDKQLVEHVINQIQAQVKQLIINANRHLDRYQQLGLPVIADNLDGFQGPLAGILAGLQYCHTEFIMTVPCDCPRPPADLFVRLKTAMDKHPGSQLAVAHDGQRLQPLFALFATELTDPLLHFLAGGRHKVHDFVFSTAWVQANFADVPDAFENFNTSEDMNADDQ